MAWFHQAAERGLGATQSRLCLVSANGKSEPKNDQQAMAWFRQAAEQGYASAQTSLGFLYANGLGVRKNRQNAYFWWLLASAQGDADAARQRDAVELNLSPRQRAAAQASARQWTPKITAQSSNATR